MAMLRILQYATVGFGFVAVSVSFFLFMHFYRSSRPVGKAVALMLLGEAIGGSVVIVFTVASDGLIDVIEPYGAMALRWVLFGTALVTSLHLAYRVWRLETKQDE